MPGRARDRKVWCWCFGRCAKSGNEPKVRSARVRDQHTADDQDDYDYVQQHGHLAPPALLLALRRTERQRQLEAEAAAGGEVEMNGHEHGPQAHRYATPIADGGQGSVRPSYQPQQASEGTCASPTSSGRSSQGDHFGCSSDYGAFPDGDPEDDEDEAVGGADGHHLEPGSHNIFVLAGGGTSTSSAAPSVFMPGAGEDEMDASDCADGFAKMGLADQQQHHQHQDEDEESEEGRAPWDDADLLDEDLLAAESRLFFGAEEDEEDDAGAPEDHVNSGHRRGSSTGSDTDMGSNDEDEGQPGPERPVFARSRHNQAEFARLVHRYDPGPKPTDTGGGFRLADLSESQNASLRHLKTWIDTNGPQKVYDGFASNAHQLRPDVEILSRKRAATLVKTVTGLVEDCWDMCVNSCKAFVGPEADRNDCEFCKEPRFGSDGRPRRQFVTLPVVARVRATYRAGAGSDYLARRTAQAGTTFGRPGHVFQDWPDGEVHQHLADEGFFDEKRNEVFLLSTDGAQILGKAKSEAWIVLLTSMNSSFDTRFKRSNTFVSTIIPGPNPPVDIESFLWPIMQELARAALGYWIWDAARQEWFLWRAWLVAATADQPGSTKINGMVGHQGFHGCRVCLIEANYLTGRQVVGYFPLNTVGRYAETRRGRQVRQRNINRPDYDADNLPLRSDDTLEEALGELAGGLTDAERAEAQRRHGVTGAPLLAASPAYIHPTFFPPDAFHLFGTNIPTLLWTVFSEGDDTDPFCFSPDERETFGKLVAGANRDLPASFIAAAPRNPDKFADSFYKFHEWSSVTYYYLLPFLLHVSADIRVVDMLAHLVQGVRLAMADNGCSREALPTLHAHFVAFVRAWEELYVRGSLVNLYRASMSIHQLLHIASFIYWHGSIRITSQARCEREIGLAKQGIRSQKAPFENIANNMIQREQLRLLTLLLEPGTEGKDTDNEDEHGTKGGTLSVRVSNKYEACTASMRRHQDQEIVRLQRADIIKQANVRVELRCRFVLPSGVVLRGSRMEANVARRASRFMAKGGLYAEAFHFVWVVQPHESAGQAQIVPEQAFVFARVIGNVQKAMGLTRGAWTRDYILVSVDDIIAPIGIFELGDHVYILHKLTWMADEQEL